MDTIIHTLFSLQTLMLVLCTVGGLYATNVVHELGHAAAAVIYGRRIVELSFRLFDAYCVYEADDEPSGSRREQLLEEIIITAAGPLANLFTGVLLMHPCFRSLPFTAHLVLMTSMFWQLLYGVASFIPDRNPESDANCLRRLWPQWRALRRKALA